MLTEQQQKFAELYVENGGNGTEAAREAGYAHPSVAQNKLLKNPLVMDAISEAEKRTEVMYGPGALKRIAFLMDKAQSERVQLQAAITLLERAAGKVPERRDITIRDNRSDEEIAEAIANKLGLPIEEVWEKFGVRQEGLH